MFDALLDDEVTCAVRESLDLLAFVVAGIAFQASGSADLRERFVLVADSASGTSPAEAAAAVRDRERSTGADGEFRIARTPTEQLSVTHYFAARGYDSRRRRPRPRDRRRPRRRALPRHALRLSAR